MQMNVKKIVFSGLTLFVVALVVFAAVFASCEVVATTEGQTVTPETLWIRLTPTAPVDAGGIQTAVLTLDFSRPIEGLVDILTPDELAKIISFDFNYPTGTPEADKLKAVKVKKLAEAIYTLTVQNIPAIGGTAKIIVNRTGITPSFRLWSLDGQLIPDAQDLARIYFFAFTKEMNSTGLTAPAYGEIDQARHSINVTVPYGTTISALKPTITHSGASITPEGASSRDFTAKPVVYVVSPKTGAVIAYTVNVTEGIGSDDVQVTITFDLELADQTIDLSGASSAAMSWLSNGALSADAGSGWDSCQWYLDGGALTGETSSTLSKPTQDFPLGTHTLSVRVIKDGKPFSKSVVFVVEE
jgi:hypothetical protein